VIGALNRVADVSMIQMRHPRIRERHTLRKASVALENFTRKRLHPHRSSPAINSHPIYRARARILNDVMYDDFTVQADASDDDTSQHIPALSAADMAGRRDVARRRYEAVFDQAPGFIAILEGAEHRIVFTNANCQKFSGGRELLGRTFAEAMPDGVAQGYLALLDEAYASGRAIFLKAVCFAVQPRSDGPVMRRMVIDVVYQPVRDESGRTCGILIEGNETSRD
jgi:PAS domain-containing protein